MLTYLCENLHSSSQQSLSHPVASPLGVLTVLGGRRSPRWLRRKSTPKYERALTFDGSTIATASLIFVLGFRGQHKRREKDIAKLQEANEAEQTHVESQNARPFPLEKEWPRNMIYQQWVVLKYISGDGSVGQ